MAAMRPKHVATNYSFVALNFVIFTIVVYDVNIYIYTYKLLTRNSCKVIYLTFVVCCRHVIVNTLHKGEETNSIRMVQLHGFHFMTLCKPGTSADLV
jgi:hypothetical protein